MQKKTSANVHSHRADKYFNTLVKFVMYICTEVNNMFHTKTTDCFCSIISNIFIMQPRKITSLKNILEKVLYFMKFAQKLPVNYNVHVK